MEQARRMDKTGRSMLLFFFIMLFPVVSAGDAKRVEIPLAGSPSMGAANPAVTIVEFLDYQ